MPFFSYNYIYIKIILVYIILFFYIYYKKIVLKFVSNPKIGDNIYKYYSDIYIMILEKWQNNYNKSYDR